VRFEPGSDLLPDEALWALVRDLPDQQRRAVALHYVGDLSVTDVAEVMECTEGTVKTHLSRARANLAQRYPTQTGGRDDA
jgi:RNA polymerase sigma-70 factor (ECF subfamily)